MAGPGGQVCRVFPDFPRLDVRYPDRFPKLATMFSIGDDGTMRFRKPADPAPPGATEADIALVATSNFVPTVRTEAGKPLRCIAVVLASH